MKVRTRRPHGNPRQLGLFDWPRSNERNTLPLPARRIAQRFNLSPYRALLIAELAGFHWDARP